MKSINVLTVLAVALLLATNGNAASKKSTWYRVDITTSFRSIPVEEITGKKPSNPAPPMPKVSISKLKRNEIKDINATLEKANPILIQLGSKFLRFPDRQIKEPDSESFKRSDLVSVYIFVSEDSPASYLVNGTKDKQSAMTAGQMARKATIENLPSGIYSLTLQMFKHKSYNAYRVTIP